MSELVGSLRRLRRSPVHCVVTVVVLSMGIGITTATWSLVETVLLRPLPFPEAERLVSIREFRDSAPDHRVETSRPFLRLWQESLESMTVGGYASTSGGLVVDLDGAGPLSAERIGGRLVTAGFFEVLGVTPLRGRLINEDDDRRGAAPVAVVREDLWRDRLGHGEILGRTVRVNGVDHTVVGVVPAAVDMPIGAEIWVPLAANTGPELLDNWAVAFLYPIGRLSHGFDIDEARIELDSLIDREMNPLRPPGQTTRALISPLADDLVAGAGGTLSLLLAVGVAVLLLVCANVAGLQRARALGRSLELATRRALGASDGALAWSLAAESVTLIALGVLGGLLFAQALLALWVRGPQGAAASIGYFRLTDAGLSWSAVVVAVLCGLVALAAAWTLPALALLRRSSRVLTHPILAVAADSARQRRGATVIQISLAMLLLLSAGLVTGSLRDLYHLDTGFDRERLLTAALPTHGERHSDVAANHRVFERVVAEVEAIPGVASAAGVLIRPLEGVDGYDYPFHLEGQAAEYGENPPVNYQAITPGYFSTMGIRLLAGRGFTATDDAEAPRSIVISRSFADRFFNDENPLGRRLRWGPPEWNDPWMTVVGVVEDASYREIGGPMLEVYAPHRQSPWPLGHLVVRVRDPDELLPAIERQIRQVDPELSLVDALSGSRLVDRWLSRPRLLGGLTTGLAAVGLLLSVVGLYGLVSQWVTGRRWELALRGALGARPASLAWIALEEALRTALFGIVIGTGTYLALQRVAAAWLGQVLHTSRLEAVQVVALAGGMLLAASLGVLGPARRAWRQSPAEVLKE